MSLKRTLTKVGFLAIVPLVGLVAVVGVLLAQDRESTPGSAQQAAGGTLHPGIGGDFIARLAQNLGIDEQKLRDALKKTALDEVDQAQANGTLTKDQADRIRNAIDSGNLPAFGFGGFFGTFRGIAPHAGGDYRGASLPADIATFLGIDADTLLNDLKGGKTLAQEAQDHGKSRDDLKNFLTKNYNAKIDQAVKDGTLDSSRADQLKKDYTANLDKVIDARDPFGRMSGKGWPGGNGPKRGGSRFPGGGSTGLN